jgi:hypothetical protein
MTVFAHLFGMWFAALLIVPWLLVVIFPMVVLLFGLAAFISELALLRRERRDAEEPPPPYEPRGPIYVGMTRRRAHPRSMPPVETRHNIKDVRLN